VVRTLLIHEYRRVILRDPLLPESLLPPNWPGSAARRLCRTLYQVTHRQTEQHLVATLQTPNGPLPEAAPYFFARFGGLT
jgi:phenylacetic acid degradation operon negative regulatory protein